MIRCENQHPIIQTCCGPRDTWQTTFKAEVVGDYSIAGKRVGEVWDAKYKPDGSVDPATCKKLRDFEDDFILLRQSPAGASPTTPAAPAGPGASPNPSPTPGRDFFKGVRDVLRDTWNDTVDTIDDIQDDIGWTESWEAFKNDPGIKRFTDHDGEHTDDGPEGDQ